jgi:hypothetical protein
MKVQILIYYDFIVVKNGKGCRLYVYEIPSKESLRELVFKSKIATDKLKELAKQMKLIKEEFMEEVRKVKK